MNESVVAEVTDITVSPEAIGLPDPATLSLDTVLKLQSLRRQLLDIQLQIRAIAGPAALVARSTVECLKCGFQWTPYNPFVPPIRCARCGCHTWNEPPTETSRRPSDPPAKSWPKRNRKGKRRPKLRVWAEGSGSPFVPREARSTPEPIIQPTIFVPPSVRSALPPPPSPGQFTGSLSSHLAQLRVDESPEQPERTLSASVNPEPAPAPAEEVQSDE